MRILWISHLLPYPPKGGVQIRSYNLLKELCRYHEVHFAGLYQEAHQPTPELLDQGISALEACCRSVAAHPFESFRGRLGRSLLALRSGFSRRSFYELWSRSERLAGTIEDHLAGDGVDAVHFDTVCLMASYGGLLPQGLPVVINHHNIESTMLERRAERRRNPLARSYFRREAAKNKALERAHCPTGVNLVVSDLDRTRLEAVVPGADIEIVPNGVDVDYFRPVEAPVIENSLLWVGGLTWYPNLQAVIYILREIWPRLVERCPDARLLVVGREPPDSLIKEAEQFRGVAFHGFVDDIRPLMSGVSGFLCPIFDGGGTRLKVLNALAMGTPLLATPMACEGVPVTHGVDVLLAETPEQFVVQAGRLFDDAALRQALSANGRRLIGEAFDYAAIGRKLEAIFRRAGSR